MQLAMAKQQRAMAISQQAASMQAQAQQYKCLRYFFVELILNNLSSSLGMHTSTQIAESLGDLRTGRREVRSLPSSVRGRLNTQQENLVPCLHTSCCRLQMEMQQKMATLYSGAGAGKTTGTGAAKTTGTGATKTK